MYMYVIEDILKTSTKYTRAPQTVHNTPVMNIVKGYFLYNTFLKEMH